MILPAIVCGCTTSSGVLGEDSRLFGSRALRDVFGSTSGVVAGHWREMCNEELNNLYCLPNSVWIAMSVMRWWDM